MSIMIGQFSSNLVHYNPVTYIIKPIQRVTDYFSSISFNFFSLAVILSSCFSKVFFKILILISLDTSKLTIKV